MFCISYLKSTVHRLSDDTAVIFSVLLIRVVYLYHKWFNLSSYVNCKKGKYKKMYAAMTAINRSYLNPHYVVCVMDNAVGCYAYGNMFWCL